MAAGDSAEVVMTAGGTEVLVSSVLNEPEVFHANDNGHPECHFGESDEIWHLQSVSSLSRDVRPCRSCYGEFEEVHDDERVPKLCPRCGAEVFDLPGHLVTPDGKGCLQTPERISITPDGGSR